MIPTRTACSSISLSACWITGPRVGERGWCCFIDLGLLDGFSWLVGVSVTLLSAIG